MPAEHEYPTAVVRVDVVTSYDIVSAGITSLLRAHPRAQWITTVGDADVDPEVVLYDVIGLHEGDGADLERWLTQTSASVVALSRELRPDLGAAALERGAHAVVSMAASADELLEVIEAAVGGRLDQSQVVRDAVGGTRRGSEAGLTFREAQTVGLIVQGLSNHEIADKCCLSINSVKSYIRSAYRKMGVETRSQAVAWGVQHGFAMETSSYGATFSA
jgi:DNA-binding NarL/FixJ family response regulator